MFLNRLGIVPPKRMRLAEHELPAIAAPGVTRTKM
jgi:hypothetical protein